MEGLDDHATSSPAADAAPRRRSGRVVRTTEKLSTEVTLNAKRKRLAELDDEDEENELLGDDERPSDEDDEDMAEEDAPRRRKKKASSQPARSKKPAAKKPKTNGASSGHASSLPSRPKKTVRVAIAEDGDGLYGAIPPRPDCCRSDHMQPMSLAPVTIPRPSQHDGTTSTKRTRRPRWPISSTSSSWRPVATRKSRSTTSTTQTTARTALQSFRAYMKM